MPEFDPQNTPDLPDDDIDTFTEKARQHLGIPKNLVRALTNQESDNSQTDANGKVKVSPKGARGRFQVMPDTAKEMGATNPDDPYQNTAAGLKYLKTQYDKIRPSVKSDAEGWVGAVAAYHGGNNQAKAAVNYGTILPTSDGSIRTPDYVNSIAKKWRALDDQDRAVNNVPQSPQPRNTPRQAQAQQQIAQPNPPIMSDKAAAQEGPFGWNKPSAVEQAATQAVQTKQFVPKGTVAPVARRTPQYRSPEEQKQIEDKSQLQAIGENADLAPMENRIKPDEDSFLGQHPNVRHAVDTVAGMGAGLASNIARTSPLRLIERGSDSSIKQLITGEAAEQFKRDAAEAAAEDPSTSGQLERFGTGLAAGALRFSNPALTAATGSYETPKEAAQSTIDTATAGAFQKIGALKGLTKFIAPSAINEGATELGAKLEGRTPTTQERAQAILLPLAAHGVSTVMGRGFGAFKGLFGEAEEGQKGAADQAKRQVLQDSLAKDPNNTELRSQLNALGPDPNATQQPRSDTDLIRTRNTLKAALGDPKRKLTPEERAPLEVKLNDVTREMATRAATQEQAAAPVRERFLSPSKIRQVKSQQYEESPLGAPLGPELNANNPNTVEMPEGGWGGPKEPEPASAGDAAKVEQIVQKVAKAAQKGRAGPEELNAAKAARDAVLARMPSPPPLGEPITAEVQQPIRARMQAQPNLPYAQPQVEATPPSIQTVTTPGEMPVTPARPAPGESSQVVRAKAAEVTPAGEMPTTQAQPGEGETGQVLPIRKAPQGLLSQEAIQAKMDELGIPKNPNIPIQENAPVQENPVDLRGQLEASLKAEQAKAAVAGRVGAEPQTVPLDKWVSEDAGVIPEGGEKRYQTPEGATKPEDLKSVLEASVKKETGGVPSSDEVMDKVAARGGKDPDIFHSKLGGLWVEEKLKGGKIRTTDLDGNSHIIKDPRRGGNEEASFNKKPLPDAEAQVNAPSSKPEMRTPQEKKQPGVVYDGEKPVVSIESDFDDQGNPTFHHKVYDSESGREIVGQSDPSPSLVVAKAEAAKTAKEFGASIEDNVSGGKSDNSVAPNEPASPEVASGSQEGKTEAEILADPNVTERHGGLGAVFSGLKNQFNTKERAAETLGAAQNLAQLTSPATAAKITLGHGLMAPMEQATSRVAAIVDKIASLKNKGDSVRTLAQPVGMLGQLKSGAKEAKGAFREAIKGQPIQGNPFVQSYQPSQTILGKAASAAVGVMHGVPNAFARGMAKERMGSSRMNAEVLNRMNGTLSGGYDPKQVENYADQVTYRDPNWASNTLKRFRDALNRFGVEGKNGQSYGVGDLIGFHYPQIAGAIATRAAEYTPVGVLGGVRRMVQARGAAGAGQWVEAQGKQAEGAIQVARGIVGSLGLGGAATLLAKSGALQRAGDDKVGKLEAQGGASRYGWTVNTGQLERYRKDGKRDEAPHPGDHLVPLAALGTQGIAISAIGAVERNLFNKAGKADYADVGTDALKDVVETLGEEAGRPVTNAIELGGLVSGKKGVKDVVNYASAIPAQFVPAILRQVNTATDPYKRETWGGETLGDIPSQAVREIKSKIPGKSEELPPRTYGGEPMKNLQAGEGTSGKAKAIVDQVFNPIKTRVYTPPSENIQRTIELERQTAAAKTEEPAKKSRNLQLEGKLFKQYNDALESNDRFKESKDSGDFRVEKRARELLVRRIKALAASDNPESEDELKKVDPDHIMDAAWRTPPKGWK